ncbi:MAG TPA: hypothetical protein VEV81_00370 [Pyrinomonadaceae bacterium]|nr:hypothetical protein [Pyrinomonadaceae bacterium]
MGKAIITVEDGPQSASEYARTERERKFWLRELPEPLTRPSQHIQIWDNYLTNTRLRLRKVRVPETKKYILKLTQKYAPDPVDLSRTVVTDTYLNKAEYEVLSIFEGNEVRKNRYPHEHEGRAYRVDVFLGALWGLILAETSFETDEEMAAFRPPPFAFAEVTNDEAFSGAGLVNLSFEELRGKNSDEY